MPLEIAGEVQFGQMVRHMNKLMDQMQKGFFNFCPGETWSPPVNLYENDAAYVVCVDLSGVDKEKIDLSVVDGQLRLRGQRTVPMPQDVRDGEQRATRLRVHLMEIDHGPFCREVSLPEDIETDRITAAYTDGMLWVEVPRKQR